MRILLTEVTGELGRALAGGLLAAGHDVQGLAQYPHRDLDAGVDLIIAAPEHPVLYRLADRADAVVVLPREGSGGPRPGEVVRVCDAAARGGARVVFPSLSLLDPRWWQPAEDLVATGWAPNLVVRIAAPVGRQADALVCRTVAALLDPELTGALHLLHVDDLIRFLVTAAVTDRTGVVELASADTATVVSVRRTLNGVDPRPRARGVAGWPQPSPAIDLSALRTQWRFDCGWDAAAAMADTARGLEGRRITATGAVAVAGRIAMPTAVVPPTGGAHLVTAARDGAEGEFDDRIDPRFPVFLAAGSAGFGGMRGPLTPMSLDLHLGGLRGAARSVARLLDLRAAVAEEWDSRLVAVFGHRAYLNASVLAAAEPRLPERVAALSRRLRGATDSPRTGSGLFAAAGGAMSVSRLLPAARMYARNLRDYQDAAEAHWRDTAALSELRDAQLDARIRLLRNRIHQGWVLSAQALVLAEVAPAQLSQVGGAIDSRAEIDSLARVLRAHPYVQTAFDAGDMASARTAAPMFARTFDAALSHLGHRGPGAAELATPVFGDRPDILLAAARRNTGLPSDAERTGDAGDTAGLSAAGLAYDTTLRFTHQLRLAVRELGRRLVAEDKLGAVDDIFLLAVEEALAVPPDARLRVKRRTAERDRLQTVELPPVVDGGWAPTTGPPAAAVGEELSGRGAVAGVAEGTVMVVLSADDAHLQAGDIAVIAGAGLDWVTLLGAPGAVIADGAVGTTAGLAVPVVTHVQDAECRLHTGMRVRVDGAAGRVSVLDTALIVARSGG
ncbi:hypothetical protein ACXDF8_07230 [Mycolicibacterium sp. CBM1]